MFENNINKKNIACGLEDDATTFGNNFLGILN